MSSLTNNHALSQIQTNARTRTYTHAHPHGHARTHARLNTHTRLNTQVELSKNYGVGEWREDLKGVMMKTGLENKPLVFLFRYNMIKIHKKIVKICCFDESSPLSQQISAYILKFTFLLKKKI